MEDIIISRTDCTPQEASQVVTELKALSPELIPHLKAWIKNEAYIFENEYEGYSMKSLMKDYGMAFTGAILTLDWLIREPERAKEALSYGIR